MHFSGFENNTFISKSAVVRYTVLIFGQGQQDDILNAAGFHIYFINHFESIALIDTLLDTIAMHDASMAYLYTSILNSGLETS